jgi:hypothetical protein
VYASTFEDLIWLASNFFIDQVGSATLRHVQALSTFLVLVFNLNYHTIIPVIPCTAPTSFRATPNLSLSTSPSVFAKFCRFPFDTRNQSLSFTTLHSFSTLIIPLKPRFTFPHCWHMCTILSCTHMSSSTPLLTFSSFDHRPFPPPHLRTCFATFKNNTRT